MEFETLLITQKGDVGIITMNRPEKMNAINNVMAYELGDAVIALNDNPDIGAIVLTGAGRGFSSGADVSRFEDNIKAGDGTKSLLTPRTRHNWIEVVRGAKPIVCAINGPCIGAGLTRTLPCDIRIASTEAQFSMRFVKVGINPEIASTQILPHIIGLQNATDLMLSGRTIGAEEAYRLGLVLKVVEPDRLMPEAVSLAAEYAENSPVALLEIKKLIYAHYLEKDINAVARQEAITLLELSKTPEHREAIRAFREKRKPDFKSVRKRWSDQDGENR